MRPPLLSYLPHPRCMADLPDAQCLADPCMADCPGAAEPGARCEAVYCLYASIDESGEEVGHGVGRGKL